MWPFDMWKKQREEEAKRRKEVEDWRSHVEAMRIQRAMRRAEWEPDSNQSNNPESQT